MTKIVNKFLLPGDTFMLEMQLGQPGFTYTVYASFTKSKERNTRFTIYLSKRTGSGLLLT